MPLDWVLDGDEDKDLSLAILDAIEDYHREVKVARPKIKGRRELYGDASVSSRQGKCKAHVL